MSVSHTDLSQMLETAVVAARLAGQRSMEELRFVRKSRKSNNELVTQADPICQKIIIDCIRENYPDHGFLCEEGPNGQLYRIAPRGDEAVWWIIDPIDGTNNFANSLLCFCVSIAAMLEGQPLLGVVFDPATDSMYSSAQDMDALLNGSRIVVNDDDIGPFASFAIDSHTHPQTDSAVKQIMQSTRFRCLGSTALHMAYVARGAMIGMVSTSARLWDIAAGAVLVERAGGIVSDLKGNKLFPVNPQTYNMERFSTLAATAKIYPKALELFAAK